MPILRGTITRESDKAVLFEYVELEFPNGAKSPIEGKSWFPHSQITRTERGVSLETDRIWISEWIAEKKGLYDEID